jgi:hypothetical protein
MARIESSVTSVSWIPLNAMQGIQKLAADLKASHWDPPPPDRLDSLDDLMAADAIRFANDQSSRTARSSRRRRSGSARMSMATILPPLIVKPMTENSRPRGATTTPAAPFTSAGRANRASQANASARSATAGAPRASLDAPAAAAAPGVDGPIRPAANITIDPFDDGARSRVTFALDFEGHGIGKPLVPAVRRQALKVAPTSYRT